VDLAVTEARLLWSRDRMGEASLCGDGEGGEGKNLIKIGPI